MPSEPAAWQRRLSGPRVICEKWHEIDDRLLAYHEAHGYVAGMPDVKSEVRPLYTAEALEAARREGMLEAAKWVAKRFNDYVAEHGMYALADKPKLPDAIAHASTSPGPVNCTIRKRFQNEAYPRTCERCGLGPCPFFDAAGGAKLADKPKGDA